MKHFIAAAITLSMLASPVLAAPYGDANPGQPAQGQSQQQGKPHQGQSPQGQNPGQGQQHQMQHQAQQQYSYGGRNYDSVRGPEWKAPKGHRKGQIWSRGDKMPRDYRARDYVVDYRAYHLKQPPRGYVWVRADRNVYLVSQKNGLVMQVVLGLFY